jgi:hypothetical protein
MPAMMRFSRRTMRALAVCLVASVAGCGESEDDTTAPPVTVPAVVLGLEFSLAGTTATAVNGALPAAASNFGGPVTTLSQRPTTTTAGTLSVAAQEPFNTVLILPTGATQYVRISLPSTTTLIGVRVIGVAGAPVTATAVTVAVANGTRVSAATALSLQGLGN